jgi:hypothetical protein
MATKLSKHRNGRHKDFRPCEEAAIGLNVLQNAKHEVDVDEVIDLNGPKKLLRKLDLTLMSMM